MLAEAVDQILKAQRKSKKPLAIVLAGHNGSGKSTLWYDRLADTLQIPLINADRMMLSILPDRKPLPNWAQGLRDTDESWMRVAQQGVQAFVVQAMGRKVPFAMETVFSHWRELPNGKIESHIDRIKQMQAAGYFVLLIFVGLSNHQISIGRVATRIKEGGHAVPERKLRERFPRTQKAVGLAVLQADAAILTDNSRTLEEAFTLCRVQLRETETFDVRSRSEAVPPAILSWLDVVCPRASA